MNGNHCNRCGVLYAIHDADGACPGDDFTSLDEFGGELAPPPNPLGPVKGAMYGLSITLLATIFGWFLRLCYIASHN